MNVCVFTGNVCSKTIGNNVVKLLVAVDREYSEGTDFHWFTCFSHSAKYCEQYVDKGDKVAIMARLQNNNYEKDGMMQYSNDLIVSRVEKMTDKRGEAHAD